MQATVYNQEGKEVGKMDLPASVFDVKLNSDLVHQVAVMQMSNRRQVSANTKGRGEVSGGGKKPWAQKHTGNARHGSIRSPIWIGGGISTGPTKEKNFKKKISTLMRRKALLMVLSEKARKNSVIVIEELKMEKPKTKEFSRMLAKLPIEKKSMLIALADMNRNLILAGRNIENARTMQAADLSALDLLNAHYILMPREAVKVLEEKFTGRKSK
ncbi:MAG: 50S ribosomal protein L4 [Candidatus Wildermuthbacteria bacterium RIFCSPHIGHO2_12_FULL_45_9]|uniref:Large ribosomal subunit protein uL4 n=1 Tax=Candidatus Wildermuthbacteria bacterium RIFCSPHIGHO2_02_FULL_45_25 TaxID=1802450 RepID=A0A1G2R5B1_9BACT|nr:MAG: 50S ribosomal protein L4 [Candidatus Wildermuthbacteria bacterium RIFCSPHIGHO2_01_FULL_45_20]OHA67917.1 MAG: 50S ribosomal protein L4 [Candidatus Wildermuthbacteria bacterium RIFCSPHIGHO2_02_FULL_45_25]OHA70581.1 MAG: 50S ribosomal protein L4 [Candidatus Wildermuthbacteria bacterium RIFCSPHIGHO2_12_FULL_45_9]